MKTTDTHVYFFTSKDVFSNWYPARFENIFTHEQFYNTEQAFMYEKAKFFKDMETAALILEEHNPAEVKKFGRMVKNFDKAAWDSISFEIMHKVNSRKFRQNKDMGLILKLTGTRTLVEASPYDKIWGVGLGVDDPNILDESKWIGQNLLGKVLMKIRSEI